MSPYEKAVLKLSFMACIPAVVALSIWAMQWPWKRWYWYMVFLAARWGMK